VCWRRLSEIGQAVESEIVRLSDVYDTVRMDCFVIMPDHVHMILMIGGQTCNGETCNGQTCNGETCNGETCNGETCNGETCNGETCNGRTQFAPTVSRVIKQWKGAITKQIGFPLWQRSFHDHIIRDERDYNRIAEYIANNPQTWRRDCFYEGTADK
jgi:REP element-mobilizing transposase RayT